MRTPRNDRLGDPSAGKDAGPERTCVLTRRAAPKETLIRLALSPDGEVAPDVRARAPGRGAYIGVSRTALVAAMANGKLRGALTRAFKQEVRIPDDLAEQITSALRQAALDRLGLEARSGTLVTGGDRIEQAARGGKVRMLIHASDAGEDGRKKLDQSWRVGGGPYAKSGMDTSRGLVFPEDRTILSMALGRENVVHVALTDPSAQRRVSNAIDRWLTFIDPDAGLQGGATDRGVGTTDEYDEGIK
jgi:predicted RNA-binding protein YlxR (DUF448 family)